MSGPGRGGVVPPLRVGPRASGSRTRLAAALRRWPSPLPVLVPLWSGPVSRAEPAELELDPWAPLPGCPGREHLVRGSRQRWRALGTRDREPPVASDRGRAGATCGVATCQPATGRSSRGDRGTTVTAAAAGRRQGRAGWRLPRTEHQQHPLCLPLPPLPAGARKGRAPPHRGHPAVPAQAQSETQGGGCCASRAAPGRRNHTSSRPCSSRTARNAGQVRIYRTDDTVGFPAPQGHHARHLPEPRRQAATSPMSPCAIPPRPGPPSPVPQPPKPRVPPSSAPHCSFPHLPAPP